MVHGWLVSIISGHGMGWKVKKWWRDFRKRHGRTVPTLWPIPFLTVCVPEIPYVLESNPHSVFGDFLNEKKLVRGFNSHLSFNGP
jgi:hypothetical protein